MKHILLVVFLSLITFDGFSQKGSAIIGLYGGAGWATKDNYDLAPSVGFTFSKFVNSRLTLGGNLFYQTYSLYYDNEANRATHGGGIAGAIVRHASSYVFVTPKAEVHFGFLNRLSVFFSGGVGFKVGGFDSLRKWDHSYTNPSVNNYDSSLDNSKNMSSMVLRLGVGFKQFVSLGRDWHFVIIEDFGFLPSSLTKNDITNPSRTEYTPQKLNPGYISLQIGIFHAKTGIRVKTRRR